jgi:hypothetical protein
VVQVRARRATALAVVMAAISMVIVPGTARSAPPSSNVASPTVVPAPAGRGTPWQLGCCYFDLHEAGYQLREFIVSGTAKAFKDGLAPAPFTTRILVALPQKAEDFNGTVLAEWENVTAQVPAEPGFAWAHNYMLRHGYGYMAVHAQNVGTQTVKVYDPVRYAALSHPGNDEYSYDIFSQAVQALKNPLRNIAQPQNDPSNGLDVERVIAYGQSQSAGRLNTYMSGQLLTAVPRNDADVVDAVFTQAGGNNKSFPDLEVPFIQFDTEDAIDAVEPGVRDAGGNLVAPNDPALYRLWEVVGTAHVGDETQKSMGAPTLPLALALGTQISWETDKQYWEHSHYGEQGPSGSAACAAGTDMPVRYAIDAAIEALHQKLTNRRSTLPTPPRPLFDADGTIKRDADGNAEGGLRLPPMAVPVATYNGTTCGLYGSTTAFDPVKLLALYPNNADYVWQMNEAIDDALADGIIVPQDADELRRKVGRSLIPLWRPSSGYGVEETGLCYARC